MSTVQVRYIVDDVDAAIGFYLEHLGFQEEMHPGPNFALLSRGDLRLALSKPGAPAGGGGFAMPDGRVPEPGGWNRFALQVDDVHSVATRLREAGVPLRSDVIEGVGVRQVIAEDPSGNPVELFEPKLREARLADGTA